jgi:hypothetical protein
MLVRNAKTPVNRIAMKHLKKNPGRGEGKARSEVVSQDKGDRRDVDGVVWAEALMGQRTSAD